VDADGKLLAIRGHFLHDHGSYTPSGLLVAAERQSNLLGPYVLPRIEPRSIGVPHQHGGRRRLRACRRPQGTFVMERLLDRIADELDLTRDEVRRRNLVPVDRCPM